MVCLDTSFIVDILRGNKESELFLEELDMRGDDIKLVAPSIMEVISGANLRTDPIQERDKINEMMSSFNVLVLDEKSAVVAGDIESDLIMSGEMIPALDIMIGAVVRENDEVLVTRNAKHFERIEGLKIELY